MDLTGMIAELEMQTLILAGEVKVQGILHLELLATMNGAEVILGEMMAKLQFCKDTLGITTNVQLVAEESEKDA